MSLIKLNNNAVKNIDSVGSVSTGSMVFIKKLTASSSATLSFVDGSDGVVLDDTYKEYYFTFKNIHPSVDNSPFTFNGSTDNGTNYNVTKTTTIFRAAHEESGVGNGLGYLTDDDLAQSTAFQPLSQSGTIGNDNDQNLGGSLMLFNPSSNVFVKHFIAKTQSTYNNEYSINTFTGGYFNNTNPINSIQFKMSSGNIDAGDICLYGIA